MAAPTPRTQYARIKKTLDTRLNVLLTQLDADTVADMRTRFDQLACVNLPEFVDVLRQTMYGPLY